ncbi:MAG: VOC family protein [Gammaproteobacteria bacterium]|jgi:catechol 2,3-dioxygenase-like lactoylglutathione lyase family enzyme|nr:VOC family protein [Gammaproteobacteria bacterium]MBP6050978.1 VOC family protein [Pseudomonadales bacterium]MBK6582485.1 VOC family protein [Gammaproteobacteria bacterium]MBK7169630.1 VOC family protein [Gammaproteobacteria bacterium]MBK7521248.1 VOC family protein [Gammaproteobacteria bacterium]
MILGVNHVAIAVADMRGALDFYCGVLGFGVVMEAELPPGVETLNRALGIVNAACKVRMVRKGNSCIELFEFAEGEEGDSARPVNRQGITHLALASDDFQTDYDRLAAHGVVFNAAPFGASPQRFAYGRDPFGNVIELLEHASDDAIALRYAD